MCRRIAGSSRDADDVCQEALIKIVRNLPRFDSRSSFGTWAYRIATNASLDELRKRDRRPRLDNDAIQSADERSTHDVDHVGDQLILDQALADLPDDLRAAVVLRDVANLDYAEIAETARPGPVRHRSDPASRGVAPTLAHRRRLHPRSAAFTDPGPDALDRRPTGRT